MLLTRRSGSVAVVFAAVVLVALATSCSSDPASVGTGEDETTPSGPIDTAPPPPTTTEPPPTTTEPPPTTTEPPPTTTEPPPPPTTTEPPPPPITPPPEPPPDEGGKEAEAPPPNRAQRALLDSIKRAFEALPPETNYAEPEESLKVGDKSTVTVTLEPLALELPRLARRFADAEGLIQITFVPVPVSQDQGAIAFDEQEVETPFEVQVSSGTLVVPVGNGEVGRYGATPSDAGEEDLFLWLKNAKINGKEVQHPFYVRVGELQVAGPGVGPTLEEWLIRIAAIVTALGVILGGGYAVWRWLFKGSAPST